MKKRHLCVFLFLLPFALAKVLRSSMKKQECLKTSHYLRDPLEFVCKDLGLCYKHYCNLPTRKCLGCQNTRTVPCLLVTDSTNNSTTFRPKRKQRRKYEKENKSPVRGILRIQVGSKSCLGFLAAVPNAKRYRIVVITAASCIARFEVTCSIPNAEQNDTVNLQGSATCFGNPEARIDSVNKGFRSYSAVLNYNGSAVTIPLNNAFALVPREFIECGDCLYDFAVLKLRSRHIRDLNVST
uniref:Peptidase S1 domain-containing protein n=1 Tax=Ciona savignyi TaxID=51511 RepID=H2ZCN6_CIOSA